MVTVPAETPVTNPPVDVMVATAVLELAHVPPVGDPLSVEPEPTQTAAVPVIPVGSGFTVKTVVRVQPVASV